MRPDVFAAVMATGIVSIAAADHGYRVISAGLLVVAAVAFAVLIVMVARAWRAFDFRDLAARLAEHRIVLWILAAMALQGWLSLAPLVARRMWRHRESLRERAHGAWELASVATSGLAIVSAGLDIVLLAVAFWVLAMCVYLLMTGLIVWRVDLAKPDSWILMGGAAIATLAGEHVHHVLLPGPIADGVRAVTIVTWVVATLWIAPLAYVTIRRFAGIGWPTVFPLGMYASATYAMYVELDWRWLTWVSLAFLWIALSTWLFVAVAELRSLGLVSKRGLK
jgi:hypothetical protein